MTPRPPTVPREVKGECTMVWGALRWGGGQRGAIPITWLPLLTIVEIRSQTQNFKCFVVCLFFVFYHLLNICR